MRFHKFLIFAFAFLFQLDAVQFMLPQAFSNSGFYNMMLSRRSGSITTSVATENDDTEVFSTTDMWVNGEDNDDRLFIGSWYGDPVWGSFRFQISTAIPAGATITTANLSLYGIGIEPWAPATDYLEIIADDSANAAQVTSADDSPGGASGYLFTAPPGATFGGANVKTRWPSSGGLNWANPGLNISPDISNIIQYLVNRHGGLAANAYIQLWVYMPNGMGEHEVIAADYGHASPPAMMVINWTK